MRARDTRLAERPLGVNGVDCDCSSAWSLLNLSHRHEFQKSQRTALAAENSATVVHIPFTLGADTVCTADQLVPGSMTTTLITVSCLLCDVL
jgi:hypothetical protein